MIRKEYLLRKLFCTKLSPQNGKRHGICSVWGTSKGAFVLLIKNDLLPVSVSSAAWSYRVRWISPTVIQQPTKLIGFAVKSYFLKMNSQTILHDPYDTLWKPHIIFERWLPGVSYVDEYRRRIGYILLWNLLIHSFSYYVQWPSKIPCQIVTF